LTEEEKVLSIILKKQQTIHYSIIFKNFWLKYIPVLLKHLKM
jgi:hypothetical protein